MKLLRLLKIGATLLMLMLGLAACEREGPLERAGENADEAIEETKENMEEAKESTEDAIKN